jgi:hypothetical protein
LTPTDFATRPTVDPEEETLRLPPRARVRRGGTPVEIDATGLVPGDLLLLAEGERLSADARLIVAAPTRCRRSRWTVSPPSRGSWTSRRGPERPAC